MHAKQLKKSFLLLLALLSLAAAGTKAFADATVTTDQPDYPPGSTAQITGTGFQAGETVQLQVLNITDPSDVGDEHAPWTVTADTNGNISTSWYVTPDEAGMTLQLTATGLTSGNVAQEIFADGSVTAINPGPQTGTLTFGTSAAATYTISFSHSGNASYSGLNVSGLPTGVTAGFTATAGSGNGPPDVTLTVTNAATTPAGTYTITIATTSPTLTSTATLTIGQAALSVTANNDSKTYGQTKTYGTGQTTFTSSGLKNGETIGSVTITASGGTNANSAVTTYTLTASAATGGTFGATNYTITYNTGTLTVNKAALGLTANNDSKTYGQTKTYGTGQTTFTPSGLQNGETVGSVTITASGGTAANAAATTYTLTPSAATGGTFTAGNYTITYNAGTLTVNKAALSITANNDSKTYGQTKTYGTGQTTFTPSGLQNGETVGSVTITASGGTNANSAVTTYTLTPSAATGGTFTAGNYTITYNTGTLTVNTAALGITANNDSKTYGQTKTYGTGQTTFTPSGLQNGETIGSVTITASGGTNANSAVAGYTLTPGAATGGTFTAGNYTITYNTGTLTVNAAALSLTANNDSKTYGQTKTYGTGQTTFTPSGLQNGETIGSVTITASGGTSAGDAVGTYTLTPSAATGGTFATGNYTITYFNGTLTVSMATTSVGISSSQNPSGFQAGVSFTATLPSDATGSVIFLASNVAFSTNTLSSGSATSLVTTSLPRGTNSIKAQYAGDGNYTGSTNFMVQIVTNHPPAATVMFVARNSGASVKISLSDLATNWSDVDGDTVTLSGINLTTTNGGTLITNSTLILYPKAPTANDQFTYSISDAHGGTNIGIVNVVLNGTTSSALSIASITGSNPTAVKAFGIPAYTYIIERSTNMVSWVPISTNTAASTGDVNVIDNFSDLGGVPPTSAFYRLSWHP
ncbi:MAG TPA: MBG domain-containing protein [Candidatus Acidoferrales bacterium]|jgi:hypothetical protein|nr:MBG domain-containing protein [Candidatus Acidoferrales bacterium]